MVVCIPLSFFRTNISDIFQTLLFHLILILLSFIRISCRPIFILFALWVSKNILSLIYSTVTGSMNLLQFILYSDLILFSFHVLVLHFLLSVELMWMLVFRFAVLGIILLLFIELNKLIKNNIELRASTVSDFATSSTTDFKRP